MTSGTACFHASGTGDNKTRVAACKTTRRQQINLTHLPPHENVIRMFKIVHVLVGKGVKVLGSARICVKLLLLGQKSLLAAFPHQLGKRGEFPPVLLVNLRVGVPFPGKERMVFPNNLRLYVSFAANERGMKDIGAA